MEKEIESKYVEFAEELLETCDPKKALASALKVAFAKEFSEENYTEIKKGRLRQREGNYNQDRNRHNSRPQRDSRSFRNQRNNRPSDKPNYSSGKNNNRSYS